MKTSGFCVCYRESKNHEWRFVKDYFFNGFVSVVVLESREDALEFLAAQGFDVDTETQIVPVTVSGRMK